jgi:hypothetical protein
MKESNVISAPQNYFIGGSTAIILKTSDFLALASDTKLVSFGATMDDAGKTNNIKIIGQFAYTKVCIYKDSKGILDVD